MRRLLLSSLFVLFASGVFLSGVAHTIAQSPACTFPIAVTTDAEFDAAINCYNRQTTPGTYTISFAADVLLSGDTPAINNRRAGIDLVIEGNGNELDGNDDHRVLRVDASTKVTVNNLVIIGNAACSSAIFPVFVSDEAQLTSAIDCYNQQTAADIYVINLVANITLSTSLIDIDNATAGVELLLLGNGFSLDGDNTHRLLNIELGSVVSVEQLTLTNAGNSAIVLTGDVTIRNSTFSNNAGVFGGAIRSSGNRLAIFNSTFRNNSANIDGGAIRIVFNDQVVIQNSTFIGNSVDNPGAFDSEGGAISHAGGTLVISNSTFFDNRSDEKGGAIYTDDDNVIIINSTFSNNSGPTGSALSIEDAGDVLLVNSILANSSGPDCHTLSGGSISFLGNNLVEDGSCGASGAGQLTGDPALGFLADNGGPTLTMALLADSPALDAGDNAFLSEAAVGADFNADSDTSDSLTMDQRGLNRLLFTAVDLGAVEFAARADCNADGLLDAGDLAALNRVLNLNIFVLPPGCDPDDDGRVTTDDAACIRTLIFDPAAVCS